MRLEHENWKGLNSMSREALRRLQNRKLARFMRHQLPYSPYYRELFAREGISFSDIQTVDDLVKLPFTSKAELAPTQEDRARPRAFMLQPDEALIKKTAAKSTLLRILWGKVTGQDVMWNLEREYKPIHLHFTTGRTALPTPFGYSARDIEYLKESARRVLDVIQVPRDIVAVNGFPYSPHLAFWLANYGLNAVGMTSLATGGGKVMGTQKIIDSIERLKAGLLLFIPGYCYHVLREAKMQGRDFSQVQYVVFGGERVSQGLRDRVRGILQDLGAAEPQIFATYALTEGKTAWVQCAEDTGYHLYPDLEYFEVIDSDGRRVPDGEPGELVYTALDWRGSAVVRYRTGDMTRGIEVDPCPNCGKTAPRIRPDIQRSSDVEEFQLTKVKGELVNLNEFYPLLSAQGDIEEWIVEIGKKNNDPYEIDTLTVKVAPKHGVAFAELRGKIGALIRSSVGVSAEIVEAPMGELLEQMGMETELKEKRIQDNRPKDSGPRRPV